MFLVSIDKRSESDRGERERERVRESRRERERESRKCVSKEERNVYKDIDSEEALERPGT